MQVVDEEVVSVVAHCEVVVQALGETAAEDFAVHCLELAWVRGWGTLAEVSLFHSRSTQLLYTQVPKI